MATYQELKGYRDLKVYQLAYKLAMEIFNESKSFPKDERFSLEVHATQYPPRLVLFACCLPLSAFYDQQLAQSSVVNKL